MKAQQQNPKREKSQARQADFATTFFMLMLILSGAWSSVLAQFNTPALDGVISAGEYGTHTDGNNQQTNGGTTWYMTWDATNLYIGISGANVLEGAVIYVDGNPIAPINGGTNADGTLVGQNYDGTSFAALQFRADHVSYFKDGYREHRIANGSNGWSTETTFSGSYFSGGGGNVREYAIPWSNITGGGIPSSFNWFGYVVSGTSFVYGEMPTENSGGSIGTSAREARYFTVSNTANGASTKPFSRNSFVFNSTTDITGFGGISVYDFTMNSAGRQIFRATDASTWTIAGNLRVDAGTIHFDNNTGAATVSGNVVISSGGTLNLGNVIGGDLNLAGNWTNNGTFNANSRTVMFNGAGTQTVSGSNTTNFGFVTLNMSSSTGIAEMLSPITMTSDGLTLTQGTFKLSSASTITPFAGATIIPSVAGFHLNHASAVSNWGSSGSLILQGKLTIDAGAMTVGSISGNELTLNTATSEATITGGTLNLSGRISVTSSSTGNGLRINGGEVVVLKVGSGSSSNSFNMGSTGKFTMTGGMVTIERANTGGGWDVDMQNAANKSITGGTIQFGNAATPAGSSMTLLSNVPLYNLTINNAAGVTLQNDATINNTLNFITGNLNTGTLHAILGASGSVTRTSGHVVGKLRKSFAVGTNVARSFEIGTGADYAPVDITIANVSGAGTMTLNTSAGDHGSIVSSLLNASKSVNRRWNVSAIGLAITTYSATFNFVNTDLDAGVNTNALAVGQFSGGWTYPTVGTRTATSTQATGIGTFGEFQLAEFIHTFTVINTNDAGAGSLRQAILDANTVTNADASTPDQIHFNITSGTGPFTITPLSALPTITDPVIIDGLTQAGASCSSWPPTLKIELNGASAGAGVNGLTITAGNSTVRGLVINRFSSDGIEMSGNGSNHIECNLLGTDVAGATDLGNTEDGVFVSGVSFNTIGGSASSRNLISGNNQRGVRILNATASNNQVLGNYIGTDVNGTADLGNGAAGVLLDAAPNNIIGGTTASLRNLISGNATFGVDIVNAGASGNTVLGNYIGTDATGTAALGNSASGIDIRTGANTNTIGGLAAGAGNVIAANGGVGLNLANAGTDHNVQGNYIGLNVSGAALGNAGGGVSIYNTSNATIGGVASGARNVISGNSNNGIEIGGTSTNTSVLGNYIGIDPSGTLDVGNTLSGVYINGASNNFIGSATTGAGNVISGNNSLGVRLANNASGNVVQGNFIGTNASGTAAVANSPNGVEISSGASNNTIGGTTAGAGNLISGHNGRGVFLIDASGNFVQGNLIGTDVTGTLDLGNLGSGIFLHNSLNNTIGGTVAGNRNIISGNNENGVEISSGSTGNLVEGNYIGTDITGTVDLGNDRSGVFVFGANNTVGGSVSGVRNVISGNNHNGVSLVGNGGNMVYGNYIGLDASGAVALGNTLSGVYLQGFNDTVGGTTADERNVISGNSRNGVEIINSGSVVQGNYIGTDAAGSIAIGNGGAGALSLGDGIYVGTNNSTIGGTAPGAGNLISGNNADGIEITGTGNNVRGNSIGTQAGGVNALGNGGAGVRFSPSAQNNTIGGVLNGASNRIAFNAGGVIVESGTGNAVQRNAIDSNTGLGIDLNNDGVTANDAGDGDTGANNLQNYPVLNCAHPSGGNTVIKGALNSTANTQFTLEFFSNAAADPSGFGEGETFQLSTTVTTDGTGNVSFTVNLPTALALGQFVSATATDPSNNTSEFSKSIAVTNELLANAGADAEICASGSTTIGGSPAATGGATPYIYSWSPTTGLNDATLPNPTASPATTTTYTLTVTDANGCTATDEVTVTVSALPTVTFDPAGPYCENAAAVDLTAFVSPAGGTFSGVGVTSAGIFTPSAAGVGTHTITYTFTSGSNCTNSASQDIVVNPRPSVSFTAVSAVCLNAPAIDLTSYVSPSGGTFSGNGVTSAGIFTPSTAGAGTHTITYSFTDGNTCTNSASQDILVNPLPVVTFSSAGPYCLNSPAVDLTTFVSPSGGTFSGTGVTVAGIFTPSTAGIGTHTITYSFTDGNSCTNTASQNITVETLPTVTFNLTGPYCVNAAVVDLTAFVSPAGGTFSGDGVTSAGIFTPSSAGAGTHTITYTFTSGSNCTNSASQDIDVNPLPSVSFNPVSAVCLNAPAIDLTSYVSPSGGTFSGDGVTNAGIFTPSTAGAGTHTITYSFTDGNTCTNTASQNIVVNPLPSVTFNSVGPFFVTDASVNLVGSVSPSGGTFSGPGISGTMFDPSVAGVGTHTVTYSFTDGNSCTNSASQDITVNPVTPVGKAFVFLANKITLKRTKQNTPAGDMHANGTLTIEKGDPSTYNSNLTATGKITIQKDNTVNGNVKSPLAISNSGTVNGAMTVGAVANEPLPGDSYTAGGLNKTVPSGGSLTLAPGSYGIVTLNNGGTLKLASGEYRMNELRYPSGAENGVIEITITGGQPIAIKVVSNFQFGQESAVRLLPNGESDSELVTFFTLQSSSLTLGHETYLLGNFNAPNAKVTLAKNSQLRGSICANEILVERDCLFLHHDATGTLPGPGDLPKSFGDDEEVISDQSPVIRDYALEQNYPNPFNPSTTISFELPEASEVTLSIFNTNGQLVKKLVAGEMNAGQHNLTWDATNEAGERVASGVYLYVVKAGEFTAQRKLVLMK